MTLEDWIRCYFCFAWLTICKLGGICQGGKTPRERLKVQPHPGTAEQHWPLLTPAATEMQSWGSEGSAPHSEPLGGSCCGCGVLPAWLGRELAWGQVPKAGGGWKRQALCGYHGTQAALSQQGQLLWGKQRGADGETPHRESLSHPFPMPPTAPETSKLPELIDYQGQISILLNYNLVLMHVFTLYLFHVGN